MWKTQPMQDLPSAITAVVVYRQGATIERRIELPLGCEGAVRVSGLPLTLLDDSVRVGVKGPEPRPVVADFRVGLQVNAATESSQLEQDLEKARERWRHLQARLEALQHLHAGLRALQPHSRPHSSDGAPLGSYQIQNQMELLAFRQQETQALEDEQSQLQRELEEAQETLSQLQHLRDSRAPAARPESLEKALLLTLRGKAGVGTVLTLRYRVPGARWAPAYSVSFSPSLDKAELTMRAMLAQRTGEDWSNVALTLSTADPNEWREIPEWKSLRIGRAEEPAGTRWYPPPSGAEALFGDFDAARSRSRSATATVAPAPPPPPPPREPAPELTGTLCAAYPQEIGEELRRYSPLAKKDAMSEEAAAIPYPAQMVMPAPASAPMAKGGRIPSGSVAFGFARSRGGGGAPGDDDEGGSAPLVETHLTVDRRFMRYQNLRLRGYTDSERGQLVALERFEAYLESGSVSWSEPEIALAMSMAEGRAAQVDSLSPPPGYTFPRAQSGFDYSYQTQAPVDAVSDGAFHSVPVFVCDLVPAMAYVCTPRESPLVFRTAEMTNPSGRALPQGPADISVGGDFLHTTPLRGVTPEGKLRLGLGVEQSIKVSRHTDFKESTSGLMGGTTELSHTVSVEAVNHLAAEVVLEIRERLPQASPQHKEEIKVLLGPVKPPWEGFEPEENPLLKTAYRWKLTIGSGQKATASATYIVEIPSKYELQGGNRREPRS